MNNPHLIQRSMATLNENGQVIAHCGECDGALTIFSAFDPQRGQVYGQITRSISQVESEVYRLVCCTGCGSGALLTLRSIKRHSHLGLADFYPEAQDRLSLPSGVPDGIAKEFREGERCREAGCFRAAAAMFRSALDKTLRANGYKEKRGTNLEQQIDAAAADGVITAARQRRAHDEIRVLGNDVLHDEWEPIGADDVAAARQYAQRILEDFYDDRESVLKLLRAKGRVADEDRPPATE
ncbi:DUF4145 domain-containing protein [Burkholderia sp. RF4-BP95]|uniref:DUF4145 domain-containing protein n=1 Tax=Burkholderia sp. RF4-BP95 TaxID=1637845 RepID=UPI00211D73E5|nr:DUF4145 domain-containing protein [Burkholderia sp. RF4-BP95]